MSKKLFVAAIAALALGLSAKAQNVQVFWDFGRNHPTTTFEMFKADKFGDTFWFIDHDYVTAEQRKTGVASAFNGWQAVKIGSQVGWVSGEYSEITTE